ncbi:family 78 glycoside hydrolase catalytic domain [Leifsonia xyli]|uniref:alpha-L-rhamnosidase n=1 Tax=Leifsonia xyli TaxID=1575 RepID=UPI003D66E83F
MTWHARMIAADDEYAGAPLLRKEFHPAEDHGAISSAVLTLTAQGLVEAWVNGHAVSDDLLTPGWSSYEWRLRYVTYDVADLLRAGATNALGLALGNGWHRGRLGWTGGNSFYGDTLGAFAQLEITYADGAIEYVGTDVSWSSGPSAVLANDLYDGQTVDARLRDDAWKQPGFAGDGWSGVRELRVRRRETAAVHRPDGSTMGDASPQAITVSPSGKTIVDFGQNLVGWIKVRVQGPEGAEVTIRHAEVLEHGELGVRPLRSAKATDRYILSGRLDEFEPTFTFHGFRYAEVSGWPGDIEPGDLTAIAIGSELERIGEFRTSDPLLNRFHENVVWGMRGNFVDVPTDCPQRDERLGWTGDIAAFAPTAAFLYDVDGFLSDWLVDLDLEQQHNDGIVGYVIPDILKYHVLDQGDGPQAVDATAIWGDAAVWVPWTLYQAYGDRRVLERQFLSMTAHVSRVRSLLSPAGVWEGSFQYGDWLDPDAPPEEPGNAKADKGVVATACAYRSAQIVSEVAAILGRSAEADRFRQFAADLRVAFNREYVRAGAIKSDCSTVYTLAIAFGLLDPADEAYAGNRLAQLAERAGYRVSTGFAGTPFIADALTHTGHTDVAYRLLMEKECPSWLYPVTMGATTIWERWDSMLPDGSINPGGMTSFNHYALGAVADWMHRVIGGIAPLTPGYASVLIAPVPGGGLTSAETSLRSRHGMIRVNWKVEEGILTVDAELPEGVGGVLRLPGSPDLRISGGKVTASSALPDTTAATPALSVRARQ